MNTTPTCGCCQRPFHEGCCCHENDSCPRCTCCVEHCRCAALPHKGELREKPAASCGTCRFWKEICCGVGQCRRHAPRPLQPGWPQTFAGDWCGEFSSW